MKSSFRWYGDSDPVTLDMIRQIPGIRSIVSAVYDVKPGEVWPEESIKHLVDECAEKGLIFDGHKLRVVHVGEGGFTLDDILVHDAHADNIGLQMALVDMKGPDFPVALGVIRDVKDITYDDGVRDQLKEVMSKSKIHCVDDLLRSGSTWEVK